MSTWGGKREGAGRKRKGTTLRAGKTEQQLLIRATLIFTNFYHNFPDDLQAAYRATKAIVMEEGESEWTAVQIAGAIAETFQTPFYGAPQPEPTPELPQHARALMATLTPEREPVATVYRRLNWSRQLLEQTISQHRTELEHAGLRLYSATHVEASGRMDRYITVDGKRFSAISRG